MKKFLVAIALIVLVIAILLRTGELPSSLGDQIQSFLRGDQQSDTDNTIDTFEVERQTDTELRTDHEELIISVVEQSIPSVVTIGIETTARSRDRIEFDPSNPFDPFRRIPGDEEEIEQNIGSGFIISTDGLIITNRHVVDFPDADYIVLTNDGEEYTVEQIYRDPLNDLAILKIDANDLPALPLGDSSQLQIGQTAIAIGTPLGQFNNTVTTGIISGLGRGITAGSPFERFVEKLDNVIQTDASISPGNSGGPLLNSDGQVIGVNTAVSAAGENIGFAIPSNVVSNLIDSFNDRGGSFERPYIGVRYQLVDEQTAVTNDLATGAYILEVIENSPADTADLEEGDIIVSFDGAQIDAEEGQRSLAEAILEREVGETVPIEIWRDGDTISTEITLGSIE